jgi:translation elongation factor EF-Tu-like GTPase
MTIESITCPNCGASLALKPGQDLVTCVYCNSNLRISAEAGAAPAVQRVAESPISTDPVFHMTVEDVFSIRDRGTVVTGRVGSGTLRVGDEIVIQGRGTTRKTVVAGIEMFHKVLDQANTGDIVGVLLKDVARGDVQRGDELVAGG